MRTARLGTSLSRPGNIKLGAEPNVGTGTANACTDILITTRQTVNALVTVAGVTTKIVNAAADILTPASKTVNATTDILTPVSKTANAIISVSTSATSLQVGNARAYIGRRKVRGTLNVARGIRYTISVGRG